MTDPTASTLSPDGHAWLSTLLSDVLNDDFLGAYQRELVGPVPTEIVEAFDLDGSAVNELFGTVQP